MKTKHSEEVDLFFVPQSKEDKQKDISTSEFLRKYKQENKTVLQKATKEVLKNLSAKQKS
jgi:hypothetical protein